MSTLELHLYDFDGTLFKAPDRPPWWGRTTWIMDSASLGPPCVPQKPGSEWWIDSAVSDAKRSIANPNVWSILCTGRALGSSHRYRVPELLKQKGLNFDEVYLNPGSDTKTYKIQVIQKLLQRFPDIQVVHIWENHLSNMAAFCKAVEATGRECVKHPITVPALDPICTEPEMDALVEQGWAKRRRARATQPVPLTCDYDGDFHLMDLRADQFVHFTPLERAEQILADGKLRMNPPYKKFGIDAVSAVSAVWGMFLPGVQTTHSKRRGLVAVVFRTNTVPKVGYPEEVVWDRDVVLRDARIVPFSKGKALLQAADSGLEGQVYYKLPSWCEKPTKTAGGDRVLYHIDRSPPKRPRTVRQMPGSKNPWSASRVASRWLQGEAAAGGGLHHGEAHSDGSAATAPGLPGYPPG